MCVDMHLHCAIGQSLPSFNDVQQFVCRGLKIIREGDDYFLIHQGQIQRDLGSRRQVDPLNCKNGERDADSVNEEQPSSGILDKILFFIGDMETASIHAKRSRLL